jgi:hypothetical protein
MGKVHKEKRRGAAAFLSKKLIKTGGDSDYLSKI